ncbi:hypothetical protein CDL15_Pgr022744 [Punica granatum]|uniref:Uncharacterized protein n=1 Tax=Punica granatum TaxID=22663 RepID=A0A218XSX5_PUNGR|nr:hypothetical protein CDL15_Pgr022744 [Punica granatum]PKI63710.1 hypothetical protein CRG98_015900 [Punica granatum]
MGPELYAEKVKAPSNEEQLHPSNMENREGSTWSLIFDAVKEREGAKLEKDLLPMILAGAKDSDLSSDDTETISYN